MRIINTETPRMKVGRTEALLENQGFTYNEAGKTYNEVGMTYGGVYGIQDGLKPKMGVQVKDISFFNREAVDTFTRTDSALTLGSTETGGFTWTIINGGTFGISSNLAYPVTGTTDSFAVIDVGSPTIKAEITITTYAGVPREQALYFRVTNTNNWWRMIRSVSNILLQKKVAGSISTLYNASATLANGDMYKIVAIGNIITMFLNNAEVTTVSDSFNNTATSHGFGNGTGSSTPRWDNFSIQYMV